jgi:hypothetical protein
MNTECLCIGHLLDTLLLDLALIRPGGEQHVLSSLGGADDQFQEFLMVVDGIMDQ